MSETTEQAVTIVGTGRMGGALARAALGAGWAVTVWNRTPENAQPYVDAGATLAGSVAEAVAASPTTIFCLTNYADSDALLQQDGVAEALAGRRLLQWAMGSPAEGRTAASWAEGRGISYLECFPQYYFTQVGEPDAMLVASGPEDVFEQVRPLLALFGNPVFLGDKVGLANAAVVASIPMFQAAILGYLHGVAYAEAEGMQLHHMRDMMVAFCDTVKEVVVGASERLESGEFDKPLSKIGLQHNATVELVEGARENGVSLVLPALLDAYFGCAVDDGQFDTDVAALTQHMRSAGSSFEQRVLERFAAQAGGVAA